MWKRSAGRCIFQAENGAKVYQNMLFRWLTIDSDLLQTMINRWHPARPALTYIHEFTFAVRSQPADCCLLGLGGAGVAHALAPYLGKSTLTAVEYDSDIIDIAKQYFMLEKLKQLHIIHQDANLFVQASNTQYQHLMVDLFESHAFPSQCTTADFFINCRRLLLPNGILAVNLTNLDEQWPLFQLIRDIFCQCTVSLPILHSANMIVLACNNPSVNPLLDLLKNNKKLKKLSWEPAWGYIAQL